MMEKVYFDHRETLYCGATFDEKKRITLPVGFHTEKYVKRAKRVEWEHVVPAENFGRTFGEWRDGHPSCVDSKGKAFRGRNCASKMNKEYRYMQSDLYNLYPTIGAVNAMRSNYNFTMLPDVKPAFGSCLVKIDSRKVEPTIESRGQIARTYLYMEKRYPRYKMSKSQKQLMLAWNREYPVTSWECVRADRIRKIQGNTNVFVDINQCFKFLNR
ncbi:endonuclease [Methylophaga sp.]|uniref:endonuclease n=1 Tax=Methylophaga sp. TaxID=2024840 RepID=UPI0025CDFF56|nr:endonuclease [Methylophaga sp.]